MYSGRRKSAGCATPSSDDKAEVKRKLELLLKIYEEGRIEEMITLITKYKAAGRAALDDLLEYADEPRPEPAALLQSAGYDPSVLGLEPLEQ